MGLRINQNIAAQNAYRNLSVSDNQMSKSLEKLSSGYRINRAADDAAGLAISEGLRSQVGGLKTAARNAQDGVSVVQTAEGALTEVHSILQRMRDLSVQAANDSNSPEARSNISTEVGSLRDELTRISGSTNFNGIKLLDGTNPSLSFQVGAGSDGTQDAISVNLTDISAVATSLAVGAGGMEADVLTPTDVAGNWAFSTAEGTAVTVDMGLAGDHTSVNDVAAHLNNHAGFAANFQASVNEDDQLVVRSTTGETVNVAAIGTGAANEAAGTTGLDYTTGAGARAAIDQINNVNVSIENLSASESRIRDTDMAQEMMSYTRSQILTQAGTAMLAQANQSQQGVLSLLR
jgi:flagellin